MTSPASILAPPLQTYRGVFTDPDRWHTWTPNKGDILVCTPPKSGTTWTQAILAMLIHGGVDLPEKIPILSPWVDANLGIPADDVAATLASQAGRRVIKTHTPANGFPVWEGVTIIAVYRHPLDVFFSLRKHTANKKTAEEDDPMRWPVSRSIRAFIDGKTDIDDFDRDTLATLAAHYTETALSGRIPDLKLFHYSDMQLDGRRTVQRLAKAAEIDASATLIDIVADATAYGAMKAKAADYAPVAGTGFWKSDADFFNSATSRKWEGCLSEEELGLYSTRLAELIPSNLARAWLENGGD